MNIFNKGGKKSISGSNNQTLDIYNLLPCESESSVMESSDYDFATTKYQIHDFRYKFVHEYILYIKVNNNIEIYNCKFNRPKFSSNFINFYIYMKNPDKRLLFTRIEDRNNVYVSSFYEVLKEFRLPAITVNTRIQFIVRDINVVMKAYGYSHAWNWLHNNINKKFLEIESLNYWNTYYVMIKTEYFHKIIEDKEYLEKIKTYCYKYVKECDADNVWTYEEFHIRFEDYNIYRSLGQHYFNSDAMFECLLL